MYTLTGLEKSEMRLEVRFGFILQSNFSSPGVEEQRNKRNGSWNGTCVGF